MHGQGSLREANGTTYVGGWRKGKHHGYGVFKWPDGATYEGMWENGLQHGKGVKKRANGDSYDGQWHRDKKHGNADTATNSLTNTITDDNTNANFYHLLNFY